VTKMLAPAYEDRLRVTMISGTMLSVHTTYLLCGWARCGASKYGTKPIGGSSIGAGGGGADLISLRDAREASQFRGDLLRENAPKTQESRMVPSLLFLFQ
jgi:hypothetical protein